MILRRLIALPFITGSKFAFIAVSASAAISTAAAQGAAASIRVQPNLATQARDGFTVCVGTAQNRALYGNRVTGSTGIVTFTGLPAAQSLVVTVNKGGYIGREQALATAAAGETNETLVSMFGGSAGPSCGAISSTTASARITVAPTSLNANKDGFYVCVGNAQNRAAYGSGQTNLSGVVAFSNLPAGGMLKATIVKFGYAGAERDWYPTGGSSDAFSVPMSFGQSAFSCPGYTPTTLRTLTVKVMDGFNAVAGAYVCVRAGSEDFRPTLRTSTRGEVAFTNLDESSGNWTVMASMPGKFTRTDISGPHRRDTAITLSVVANTTQVPCAGTPPPPTVTATVPGTTIATIPLAPDPPRLAKEVLAIMGGDVALHSNASELNCFKFGANYVMTGLSVQHKVTALTGISLYCAPLRSDGTLGTRIVLPGMTSPEGTVQRTTCAAGRAVTGWQGTLDTGGLNPIRSITIHCGQIGSLGLITGSSTASGPVGVASGPAWGPSLCTQGRPATGIMLGVGLGNVAEQLTGVRTVATMQLVCEQPLKPRS